MRRWGWWEAAAALATLIGCTAILLALRAHLSPATDALVLVVPVLVGVSAGGFWVGAAAAAGGFFVYDWFFLPPYSTLTVGRAEDWVALVIYLLVVLVVARLVAVQQRARVLAGDREGVANLLLAVSEQLMSEQPLDVLLERIATAVQATFQLQLVAVLLPGDDGLQLVASAGELTDDARRAVLSTTGVQPLALSGGQALRRVALTALQRPVGQLVVAGDPLDAFSRRALGAFANQAALAIERSQLRAKALRTELLEDADRWRSALLGAVSHDLRTPLSAIKAAIGTLRESAGRLATEDRESLLATIDSECDHLTRLVANVLDMARIDAGQLQIHAEPHQVADVVTEGLVAARWATTAHHVTVDVDAQLPLVEVDLVLMSSVLANLVTNAAQHSPEGSTITVAARRAGPSVLVEVRDEGSGVPPAQREQIFHLLDRRAGSGRAGLGLAIASAFVAAHGGRISVADAPGGGAAFQFTLPVCVLEEATA